MLKHKRKNKNSLARVVLSNYDSNNIYEIKIKYEKLAKLDKINIIEMDYDADNNVMFKKVLFNNKEIDLSHKDKTKINIELDNKKYNISAKKQIGKTHLVVRNKQTSKISRIKKIQDTYYRGKDVFILDNNIEILDKKQTKDKFIVTLNDITNNKTTSTEAELIDDTKDIFKKISAKKDLKSSDIYKIKRFISIRSNFSFYYTFVDNYFKIFHAKKDKNKEELYKIKFKDEINIKPYLENILDNMKNKNGILYNYANDRKKVLNDLRNIQYVFKEFRHKLAHFDYNFLDNFFSNSVEEKYKQKVNEIKLLDILLDNIDSLNVVPKQNYIEDETISVFDAKDIKLKRLYTYYIKLTINYPGFKKLINSFFIQDGIENQELKEYINNKEKDTQVLKELDNKAYYMDISQYRKYKNIYNKHKELVSEKELSSDGKKINSLNQKINKLKIDMKNITKPNALNRLIYRLRVAFGFIYKEYATINNFNKSFLQDTKTKRFENISQQDIKSYLDISYQDKGKFFVKSKKTFKNKTTVKYTFEDLDLTLNEIITQDDIFVKVIFLFSIFMPKELNGDFFGFINMYYHKMKNISYDTKDIDMLDTISQNMKLKILEQNIKKTYVFKYYLDLDSSIYSKLVQNIKITEDIDSKKYLYAKIFKYYQHLYKLISDVEIYLLYKYNSKENLSITIDKDELKHRGYYNFQSLLIKNNINKDDAYWSIVNMRNNLSHQNIDELVGHFCKGCLRKSTTDIAELWLRKDILTITNEIINKIESFKDIKITLGYDCVNDFTQKVKQYKQKLKASNERLAKKIEEKQNQVVDEKNKEELEKNILNMKNIQKINRYILDIL